MIKIKRISIILIILAVIHFEFCFAQEPFFPLSIGNVWYYNLCCGEDYSITVIDTTRIQDVKYFKVNYSRMKRSKKPIGSCEVAIDGNPLNMCGKPAYYRLGRGKYSSKVCDECYPAARERRVSSYTKLWEL